MAGWIPACGSLMLLCVGAVLARLPGVTVPRGPLHRVEGSHVSLSCNVSGYAGSGGLDFEWSLLRQSDPVLRMGLISTRDEAFTHASFQHRVSAGEIRIKRTSPTSVQLLIRKLRKSDEGDFECSIPPAEGGHRDPYKAHVQLRVLQDTLQLTEPEGPLPLLSLTEGQSLALHCRAASHSALHTHLSVRFVLGDGRQTVVGLDREQVLGTDRGGPFWTRFTRGEVGLRRLEHDTYHLRVQHVWPADSGRYLCVAAQWVQDPDGHWHKILEKSIPLVELTVRQSDLALRVEASVAPTMFYRGDTVTLLCNVTLGRALGEGQLSVSWWGAAEEPLVRVDRRGVSLPTRLGSRTPAGTELSTDRPAELCFRLHLYGARREDQGHFRCHVGLWTQNEDGHWGQAAEASSPPTTLFLYLTLSDTLLVPAVVGVLTSLLVSVAVVAGVTCCFLRRLARRRGGQ